MTNENTYNGWTNYATWRVNLEMFDGFSIDCHWEHEEWKEMLNKAIREAVEKSPDDLIDNQPARVFWFKATITTKIADYLKELVNQSLEYLGKKDRIAQGWASAFVDQANFREIAEHLLVDDSMYKQALANVEAGAEEIL